MLKAIQHRPWPFPQKPWVMRQIWHDLLFAHWPISPELLREKLPRHLSLDIWEKQAWLGIVPFRMSGVSLRFFPDIPRFSAFPELNVRTYVTFEDKPGVYFFSLDAANPLAVEIARRWYHLPYFHARMELNETNGTIQYQSHRTHRHAFPAVFEAEYQPTGSIFNTHPGALEHWLTERYCLYTSNSKGQVYRGEIHHLPWSLQRAETELKCNTMGLGHSIELPDTPPLLHFSQRLEVVVWPLQRIIS